MRKNFKSLLLISVIILALFLCSCNSGDNTKRFSVTFMNEDSVFSTTSVKEGQAVTKPSTDPSKVGYDFQGWYLDDSSYNFSAAVTNDLVLTAKWAKLKYTVKYIDPTGVSTDMPQSSECEYGSKVTLSGVTDTGFDGWSTLPFGKGTKYTSGADFTPSKNTILYAVWNNRNNSVSMDCLIDANYSSAKDYKTKLEFDPIWFVGEGANNKTFNNNICRFSSIVMSDIYSAVKITIDGLGHKHDDNWASTDLYKALGFEAKVFNLANYNYTEDEDDITYFIIAHSVFKDENGNDVYLFIVNIKGTDGTLKQWRSNCDVGYYSKDPSDSASNTYKSISGSSLALWKNKNRHKGFEVTSQRVKEKIDSYIASVYPSQSTARKVMLITGHSRGAAVANILGAEYETESKQTGSKLKPFTYTFASPNTVEDHSENKADSKSFKTIFNIINKDDLVAAIPPTVLGFTRYGQTDAYSLNMGDSTNLSKYYAKVGSNYVSSELSKWSGKMDAITSTRKAVYEFESLSGSITRPTYNRLLDSYLKKRINSSRNKAMPAFLYSSIAYFMGGADKTTWAGIAEVVLKMGSKYADFIEELTSANRITGITYGHEQLTYIVLSEILTEPTS